MLNASQEHVKGRGTLHKLLMPNVHTKTHSQYAKFITWRNSLRKFCLQNAIRFVSLARPCAAPERDTRTPSHTTGRQGFWQKNKRAKHPFRTYRIRCSARRSISTAALSSAGNRAKNLRRCTPPPPPQQPNRGTRLQTTTATLWAPKTNAPQSRVVIKRRFVFWWPGPHTRAAFAYTAPRKKQNKKNLRVRACVHLGWMLPLQTGGASRETFVAGEPSYAPFHLTKRWTAKDVHEPSLSQSIVA